MKKILIFTLLLTNLCTGLAFALDTHSESVAGHDSAAINFVTSVDDGHPDGELHHGDHCCHGAAHLVGITLKQTTPFVSNNKRSFFTLSQAPNLRSIPPLLRPPIA